MSHSDLPNDPDLTDELVPLLTRLTEELLGPAEHDRLADILRASKPARDLYRKTISIHALLHWRERQQWTEHHETGSDRYEVKDEQQKLELQVSPENIRELLEEDAEVEQRKSEERARIETLAAEKFSAFRQEQDRNRRPEPIPAPRNAFYATVSSLATAGIFFILWMLPDPVPVEPVPVFVASIDDSIDARWSDPSLSTAPGTQLFTLENLVLTRGVVQIGFEGGAKMVVEAPATLELLSADSARLDWGKLVGRVPRDEVRLTIKTPRASITDLGTEFGVEVNRQQVTHLHVFEGSVSAETLDAEGKTTQQRTVLVDETVYLQPKTSTIEPAPAAASPFVRRLLFPLPLYSTGIDLAEGDDDLHWQIVAAQNVPNFIPQPAVVTTPGATYSPNDSRKSQWVSTKKNLAQVDPDVRYTFQTTFDLSGFDSATASIRGSFSVDNQVTAIRVNGIEIPVPEHPMEEYREMFSFFVNPDLLKADRNQLELDVFNGGKNTKAVTSPIALRVLLEGMGQKIE